MPGPTDMKPRNGMSFCFPDVCKVPAPPAPFTPAPLPNIPQQSGRLPATQTGKAVTSAASGKRISENRAMMSTLHQRMLGLPATATAQQWHDLLEQYVLAATETFKSR